MAMTPAEYFASFVEGNFEDCLSNPGCVRRAFNASVAASHLADHYFTFNARHHPSLVFAFPTIGPFVEHIDKGTGGAFRDIRSIANAYKHLYTDVSSQYAAHSTVSSAGSIDSIQLADDSDLEMVSEEYVEDRYTVVFTRKDGTRHEFLPALERVVDFWRESL